MGRWGGKRGNGAGRCRGGKRGKGRDIGEAEIELGGTCHNDKPGHEGWGSWRENEGGGGV